MGGGDIVEGVVALDLMGRSRQLHEALNGLPGAQYKFLKVMDAFSYLCFLSYFNLFVSSILGTVLILNCRTY